MVVGLVKSFTARYPEGMLRVALLGDPSREPWVPWRSRSAERILAALELARAAAGPAGVVRRLGRREDLDGERHREHGLDLPRAAEDRRVHPGRRRDQRRGHRHQRRRPALLERRGHHAHAHPGHPGHVPGLGHGAHRQGGARLLRKRLGRGQPGHRRLRPDHGTERPGPVPGQQPGRGPADPAPPLRAHLRRPRGAVSPARRDPRPRRPRRPGLPPRPDGGAASRRWATSSARRRTPTARSPSTSAR